MPRLLLLLSSLSILLNLSDVGHALLPGPAVSTIPLGHRSRRELEGYLGHELSFEETRALRAVADYYHRLDEVRNPLNKTNPIAIAGFAAGAFGFIIFGWILAPLSVAFGIMGIDKAKRDDRPFGRLAAAGIFLAVLKLIGMLLLLYFK